MTVPKPVRAVFRHVPGAMHLSRLATAAFMDLIFFRVFINYRQVEPFARLAERLSISHLRKQVDDPALADKLVPDYDWGCKRPSFSNKFYPVFNRDNVELVTDPITRLTENGIVTKDGKERPIDVLICATGYQPWAKESLPTQPIYGKDGVELTDFWDTHHYQAFRGIAINNYPNYFMICGPYSIAHSSYIGMVETSVRYIVRLLKAAKKRDVNFIEVKADDQLREHREILRKRESEIFFSGSCETANTYYYDRFGDTPNFRPSNHPRMWADSRFGRLLPHFNLQRKRNMANGEVTALDTGKSPASGTTTGRRATKQKVAQDK
jgi:cation diffusion facilitator CzcD-associated flavoprotein CzcO